MVIDLELRRTKSKIERIARMLVNANELMNDRSLVPSGLNEGISYIPMGSAAADSLRAFPYDYRYFMEIVGPLRVGLNGMDLFNVCMPKSQIQLDLASADASTIHDDELGLIWLDGRKLTDLQWVASAPCGYASFAFKEKHIGIQTSEPDGTSFLQYLEDYLLEYIEDYFPEVLEGV